MESGTHYPLRFRRAFWPAGNASTIRWTYSQAPRGRRWMAIRTAEAPHKPPHLQSSSPLGFDPRVAEGSLRPDTCRCFLHTGILADPRAWEPGGGGSCHQMGMPAQLAPVFGLLDAVYLGESCHGRLAGHDGVGQGGSTRRSLVPHSGWILLLGSRLVSLDHRQAALAVQVPILMTLWRS